ncbi:MAG TPA: thiamine pyrophosphate-binding protein [Alphaproteobacteria bacterium]
MSERITVGEAVAAFLERCGVTTAFGVISIHNLPILDAFARRNSIRFVPSRGEAGAVNMADAYARVGGQLGVAITSTGTGAGNAAGAMVEAQTAGTPLLHLTGQIELPYLDRQWAYIHEAVDQLSMLSAVSKRAYRVWSPETALGTLKEAVRTAFTAPSGPVSVEIPIDVQEAMIDRPPDLDPLPVPVAAPAAASLVRLAAALRGAKRPLLWVGGGARHAGAAVRRLVELGFGVVTSTQGRGIVPEDHPLSLGAYTVSPDVEKLYATCDAMLVVGSRLRGNETLKYTLKLPRPLYRIDANPEGQGRSYATDLFVVGDSAPALDGLADRLAGKLRVDPRFAGDIRAAREAAEAALKQGLKPYDTVVDALQTAAPRDFIWVRDVTVSNSTWGNRYLRLAGPRNGVHALGGGIGMGAPMAIGAALAAGGRRTVALAGDGGLQLNLGELATAVQERADIVLLVMNDRGYGVIRNIQDARFGGRKHYVDLHTPNFAELCKSLGLRYLRLDDTARAADVLRAAFDQPGPVLVEIDMTAIGPYASRFAGPPVRAKV